MGRGAPVPPRPVALVPVHRQGACTLRLGQTKLRCSEARSTGLLAVPPGTCIGSRRASRRSRPRTRFARNTSSAATPASFLHVPGQGLWLSGHRTRASPNAGPARGRAESPNYIGNSAGIAVNGHLFLPIRGHLFSPLAAMISPHWRPSFLPTSWVPPGGSRSGASPPFRRSLARAGSCPGLR